MLYNKEKDNTRKKLGRFFSGIADRFSMETMDLIWAIDKNDTETVRRAMNAGMNPNKTDGIERRPLPMAIDTLNEEMIALLLAGGADPNLPGRDGETPLYKAVTWAHEPIVKMLLDAGADPAQATAAGVTPMEAAQAGKSASMVNLLANPSAAQPKPEKKKSAAKPITKATAPKVTKTEQPAAKAKPAPKKRTASAATKQQQEAAAKNIAIGKQAEAAAKKLKEKTADIAAKAKEAIKKKVAEQKDLITASPQETPSKKTTAKKSATTKKPAAKKTTTKKPATPVIAYIKEAGSISGALIKAITEKEAGVIDILIQQIGEKDINKADATTGLTPLLTAIEQKHAKATGALIDKGADVLKVSAKKGHSPLSLAVSMDSFNLVKFIIEKSDPTAVIAALNNTKQVVSPQFIAYNKPKMLNVLLEAGADIHFGGEEGTSPLLKGLEKGSIGLLPLYAKHKIDMNQEVEGKTLLEWAIKHNRIDWVNGLIAEGAKADVANKNGQTALEYAESFGGKRSEIVDLLG